MARVKQMLDMLATNEISFAWADIMRRPEVLAPPTAVSAIGALSTWCRVRLAGIVVSMIYSYARRGIVAFWT